ncbi:hypothetical protein KQI42_06280 [Tissierella sp. MSJ-40]|jgi:hypothetical protein|uniref:Uncharacterized protein n=1 Tax=Tissierella simiarum TaxID=2841534 RepID=A0ABS6E5B6_9FIRM|nr:hypothetical protein [Tissierella simiarum]MBU5437605.1 hypothetical protein [Tissierella simiarum]
MKRNIIKSKLKRKIIYKKCGAITCLNNISGLCSEEKCELFENLLIQED